jgi:hypothetical protein
MAVPTPLIAADIILDVPVGKVRPAVYLDQNRLKSIALQYEQVYIVARSERDVQVALDEGRLQADDVIEPANFSNYDVDVVLPSYAALFEVAPEQVARFFKPLPVEANSMVSRSLYRGLAYGAQSLLPGFAEIDLWSSTIQSTIVRQKGQEAFDRRQTEKAMRDRLIAAWLWIKDGIPTVTGNSLLFDIIKELTTLNLTLNQDLLRDERPLWETIHVWVDRFLRSDQPQMNRIACEPVQKIVPHCASLSWQDVFRLRERPGFHEYLKITEGLQSVTSEAELSTLLTEVNNQMFELVAEAVPKPSSVLCQGVVEEVAGWFLPGIGIVSTAKEAYEARKRHKNYAAIFWLIEARKAAAAA